MGSKTTKLILLDSLLQETLTMRLLQALSRPEAGDSDFHLAGYAMLEDASWLDTNWMFLSLFCGVLGFIYLFSRAWPGSLQEKVRNPLWLAYLAAPVYSVHQFEEHGFDIYGRRYMFGPVFNAGTGTKQGIEVTYRVVTWVNVVGICARSCTKLVYGPPWSLCSTSVVQEGGNIDGDHRANYPWNYLAHCWDPGPSVDRSNSGCEPSLVFLAHCVLLAAPPNGQHLLLPEDALTWEGQTGLIYTVVAATSVLVCEDNSG